MILFGFANNVKKTKHVYFAMNAIKIHATMGTKFTFITLLQAGVVIVVIAMRGTVLLYLNANCKDLHLLE